MGPSETPAFLVAILVKIQKVLEGVDKFDQHRGVLRAMNDLRLGWSIEDDEEDELDLDTMPKNSEEDHKDQDSESKFWQANQQQ